MGKKWQVTWYDDPYWPDGTLAGKVELTEEYYIQPPNYSEAQAEFFVNDKLEIRIDEVHDDESGDWKGMPKYIEVQIKRDAKRLFKELQQTKEK